MRVWGAIGRKGGRKKKERQRELERKRKRKNEDAFLKSEKARI